MDRWMLSQFFSLAPNAQLLVLSYGATRTRLTALKMATNFPSLKHLVLVNVRHSEEEANAKIDAAVLDVFENQCLRGIQGVTVIKDTSVGLELFVRAFVKACAAVPTIRKLAVHYCRGENFQEINLASLGVDIPENLTVETRSIEGDGGKVVLEGIENSMMTWYDLRHWALGKRF